MKSSTQSYAQLPTLVVENRWQEIFEPELRVQLLSTLQSILYTRRWFGGKARNIRSAQIVELISIPDRDTQAAMVWLQVEYAQGDRETYVLLLGYAQGQSAHDLQTQMPASLLAQVRSGRETGVLFEATAARDFLLFPLEAIANSRRFSGQEGQLIASQTELFEMLSEGTDLEPRLIKSEQSNTSIIYGDRLILKFFRKIEPGINPDLEIGRFLSEHGYLEHFASIAGALEYQGSDAEPTTVASLQQFVPNNQDAWQYTLDCLQVFLAARDTEVSVPSESPLALSSVAVPELAGKTIGSYLEDARLLGQRTAELHVALASDLENPDFTPEPFTSAHQRSIVQNLHALAAQNFGLLKKRLESLSPENQKLAQAVCDRQEEFLARFESIASQEISALRTRCHGDYHLGQVLYTGEDFIIIDFEGEPARPMAERRMKLSPLRDVAGMLQSFNYAANMGLRNIAARSTPEKLPQMKSWAQFWFSWVSAAFLDAYLKTAGDSFLPKSQPELQNLLDIYLFEKATYELGYELNNRPDWVDIPLQRLLQL